MRLRLSGNGARLYYGWISEAVFETASIAPGRKSFATRHPRYSRFTFAPLAVNRYQFLRGVQRIALEGCQIRCQVLSQR